MELRKIMNIYCGEMDSIDHTFRDCHFVKIFIQRAMELRKIMNAYIVVKWTLLTILLEIVISSRFSFKGLLV